MPLSTEARLEAAQRTIAALVRRVENTVGGGTSAFAVLEQSIALERVVAEKTAQLEAQRAQLQEAVAQLGATQAELLQAQKLESVGRLAAGVAHEINTPIQFVSDSVDFVREAFQQLGELIPRYVQLREAARQGRAADVLADVVACEESVDLDYLLTKVPRALDRAVEGLGRVATLVRSMKEFAHPDGNEKAPADLGAALASTLAIARHEYKYVAEVELDAEPLPLVPCHVGELNQVFLNLLVNAAQAIQEVVAGTGRKGLIRIEVRRDGESARISISDTGAGIPQEIRHRIFDPFFTTKEVGKGTGQGLSIARNVVVEKHQGTLTFDSEVGRGTTFHVRIPIGERPRGADPLARTASGVAV